MRKDFALLEHVMRSFAALLTSLLLTASAPVSPYTRAVYLNHPFGRANEIRSPDGRHALWGDYENSELKVEDIETHAERPVTGITVQTLSLAWSLDSRYFVVNDRPASDLEDALLFNTATLERIKLRDRLTAARPEVIRYYLTDANGPLLSHGRNTLHSYLHVLRWLDGRHVELQLHGNTSSRFANDDPDGHLYPAECFDLRYSVGIDGSVRRISGRVFPLESAPDDDACGWGN
jgi:hypothetical protein